MHEHRSPPRARKDGLIEEAVGEELLLYDQDGHTAHCLSPIAACVWRHCNGERDVTKLAKLAGASESLITDALHELREKHLLDAEPELTQNAGPGESRREALVRVARYGAAAAAGSMIVSATAATPAMAASEELVGNCCQCYERPGFVTPCACSNFRRPVEKCSEYCRSEGGFAGPICSRNGSGQVINNTTCGSGNLCR